MAIEEQIRTMPVVALKGLTILPGMMTHFDAVKRQDIAAVEYALVGDQKVFLVTQRNPEPEEPELEDLYQVGTIALVKQLVRLPGKVVRVLVEGLRERRAAHPGRRGPVPAGTGGAHGSGRGTGCRYPGGDVPHC